MKKNYIIVFALFLSSITTFAQQINIANNTKFCETDPAVQLTASPSGGYFLGNGVTSSGLFTPGTAGIGKHTITYHLNQQNGIKQY